MKYICKFCKNEFKNAGALASHIKYCKLNPNKVKKQDKKFQCQFCNKKIGNKGSLLQIDNHIITSQMLGIIKGVKLGTRVYQKKLIEGYYNNQANSKN